jgi:hypothetical protein
MDVSSQVAGNGHHPGFDRMNELAMTASGSVNLPAIVLQQF